MNAPLNHYTFQQNLFIHKELIVDLFAGGGGFSEGIRMASGRNPDIAINHSEDALSMHQANHPDTEHFVADVFEVCPRAVTKGLPIGHLHASPDCTHHSQAAGGQPRNEKRRALSWVVIRWAGQVKPRVITLENVKQVQQWGALIAKRCPKTGRVMKLEKILDLETQKMVHVVAEKGERVPRELQFLVPDPKKKGKTWRRFISLLRDMGYEVGVQMMAACNYGAGTTRDRLFMHARNDGMPVEFPEPVYFKKPKKGQKKWSPAYEHIDFTKEGKSIFDRDQPLKGNTMRRVAKGIKRFVLDNPEPFIVQVTQSSSESVYPSSEPLRTITTAKGGEYAIATPVLVQAGHGEESANGKKRWGFGSKDVRDSLGTITGSGDQAIATAYLAKMKFDSEGMDLNEPLPTITAGGNSKRDAGAPHSLAIVTAHLQQFYGDKSPNGDNRVSDISDPLKTQSTENRHALVTAFLTQYNNHGNGEPNVGHAATEPVSTIISGATTQGLVSAHLCVLRKNQDAEDITEPVSTICTSGSHHALVECELSQDDEVKALRVAAFLISYYGTENMSGVGEPMPTITTKDRLALVTVYVRGTPYVIVDIKLRMLDPPELFSATGFGKHYIFTHGHDGRIFSKAKQVKMCGNAVSPLPAAALFSICHKHDDMRLAA